MFIQTEATPNPEVLKFLPGREVLAEGSRDFRDMDEAQVSPLATTTRRRPACATSVSAACSARTEAASSAAPLKTD